MKEEIRKLQEWIKNNIDNNVTRSQKNETNNKRPVKHNDK